MKLGYFFTSLYLYKTQVFLVTVCAWGCVGKHFFGVGWLGMEYTYEKNARNDIGYTYEKNNVSQYNVLSMDACYNYIMVRYGQIIKLT